MRFASALIVLVVAHLVIGFHLGYRDGLAFARFWLLAALAIATAAVAVSRGFGSALDAELVARVSVVSFAVVVVCGLVLGWIGRLLTPAYLLAQAALLVGAARLPRRDAGSTVERDTSFTGPIRIPPWLAGVAGALTAFAVAFAIG